MVLRIAILKFCYMLGTLYSFIDPLAQASYRWSWLGKGELDNQQETTIISWWDPQRLKTRQ